MLTAVIEEPKKKEAKKPSRICSDHTEDCKDIPDGMNDAQACYIHCWLGVKVSTGMADGICPFIHKTN